MKLEWHCDEFDRTVYILEGSGWKFQYDDSLPFDLHVGDTIMISNSTYHRIHKGQTDLKIKIIEHGR